VNGSGDSGGSGQKAAPAFRVGGGGMTVERKKQERGQDSTEKKHRLVGRV
jgi:hypothetical protein